MNEYVHFTYRDSECTITQTRLCNILQYFTAVKNDNLQVKNCDFFLTFAKNIYRGYTLGSNEHPQSMFWSKNKKIVYSCKAQFYYIKVGCKGDFITRTSFRDDNYII